MTKNMLESYFIRTIFRLVVTGTVWHLFPNFEMKRPKRGFWNILPIIEKIPKFTPAKSKIRKSEHDK